MAEISTAGPCHRRAVLEIDLGLSLQISLRERAKPNDNGTQQPLK